MLPCSTACERVVAELINGLGSAEAARRRFAHDHPPTHSALQPGFLGPPPQPQTPPREEEAQQPAGTRARTSGRARSGRQPQREEAGARGVGGVTVMSATIQVVPAPQPHHACSVSSIHRMYRHRLSWHMTNISLAQMAKVTRASILCRSGSRSLSHRRHPCRLPRSRRLQLWICWPKQA